ncbi:10029_t:CDS:2 [Diversispora eburnea]|uniref:10029_t:CDS:1 n=1 Tax=Diversispora eburnea TaxID=1213867 RepID=A0A9N9GH55_9GLOM|nr:10029_t:CDS:2 [Diversispora eburnea]
MPDAQSQIDLLKELNSKLVTDIENDMIAQVWSKREKKKSQTRCIQIVKEILNEEPIIEYHPSFLNGLEIDTLLSKIPNCVRGTRCSTSAP